MCVCRCPWKIEKSESLELDLHVVVILLTWVPETALKSSAEAICMFNSELSPRSFLMFLNMATKPASSSFI